MVCAFSVCTGKGSIEDKKVTVFAILYKVTFDPVDTVGYLEGI